jgi:hypothetical protein
VGVKSGVFLLILLSSNMFDIGLAFTGDKRPATPVLLVFSSSSFIAEMLSLGSKVVDSS